MIALILRFGRSASIFRTSKSRLLITIVATSLLLSSFSNDLFAIGTSGLFSTKVKLEYQYSDYEEYRFPTIPSEDESFAFLYLNPYISNFPEHRSLAKVTQLLGPITVLEMRYEYSDLDKFKDQHRIFGRLERDIADMTTLYGALQYLSGTNTDPDSASADGTMMMLGIKHDRSGWIKAEASISYDNSSTSEGLSFDTYMPMMKLRWSVNSVTALTGRWDGYWTVSEGTTYPAHAFTVFVSRYFQTQTAVHLFSRFYTNDSGIESFSPSVEVAQYIRWNLTGRINYRFYRNWFEGEAIPEYIEGDSITAHSVRAYIEWQVDAYIKLHFKFRKYISDQNVNMNTYLLGFEYEL